MDKTIENLKASPGKHAMAPWTERNRTGGTITIQDGKNFPIIEVKRFKDTLAECDATARLVIASPEILFELGGIADALRDGTRVVIDPDSVKAKRIFKALEAAEKI